MPSAAYAQSTGTVTTEEQIVITGARTRNVGGIQAPDTTKAKATITKELIDRQQSGQTILNVINLVPGVNFTNSDPYGSSGGNIRIRGFDGNRISLTFDGVPLNDSGNYAIFSNQQLDPELIEQVNVGLGVTDVDSPTASAAGGTVNYRTIVPSNTMGARLSASAGDFNYYRLFGMVQTGTFTSFGTKAWLSASHAENDKFKGPGKISKYQFNGRIYQPIGSNGDFISVAGHYNRNRNNFYRNPSVSDLRGLLGTAEIPPVTASPAFPTSDDPIDIGYFNNQQVNDVMGFENLKTCNLTVPQNGVTQNAAGTSTTGTGPNGTGPIGPAVQGSTNNNPDNVQSCTNLYTLRINPSNTGNVRGQSRFTLRDGLILTVDPSYQYVLANGGGTSTLAESSARAKGAATTSSGVDFNGDGDFRDTVRFYTPNNTNTNRISLTSSLIWDINPSNRVRVAYTYDRAHHRQTGEWGFIGANGEPGEVFGGRNGKPVLDATGFVIQQRDRTSIALLNQLSGQYIGKFFDDALRVEVGVRRPWFKRNLSQHCYTEARGSGFAYCTSEPASTLRIIGPDDPVPATGPTPYYAPFQAKYKYGKLLPNLGFTYKVTGPISIFGSYAKGFSAPRTDNLYRSPRVGVQPEETDAFDLGARYTTGIVQAQLAGWKINYKNRIVTSFNQDLGISIDRNVGKVDTYGFDGSVAVKPVRNLTLLALASYIHTKLKDNIEIGTSTAAALPSGLIFCSGTAPTGTTVAPTCAPTAGKKVAETPTWQFGGRVEYNVGPFSVGLQGKHVGARFATDVNDVRVKGYNLVDLDARFMLDQWLKTKGTYLQFNLQNVFDQFYFGNLSTQIRASDNPNFAVGSPRTFSATLNVGF
ncbi:MAG: TonB-dependent receptor [Bradyrhizobium sp.]|nr:TonB-dependent receptor [Bradyrhizobium sp.]